MAWELVSKEEVGLMAGAKEQELRDEWYEMAVAIIERYSGLHNLSTAKTVTEVADGDGSPRLFVKQPPIASVTSVKVDGLTIDSNNYYHTDKAIVFKDDVSGEIKNPYMGGLVFTEGRGNIEVTYVSGPTTDKSVSLAIALIVKELAGLRLAEGAESRLQFVRQDRRVGDLDAALWSLGVHGKILAIVRSMVGTRFRAR